MTTRLLTAAVVVVCCTVGCAPALYVTFHSDPEGAILYESTRLWGYTPFTLKYHASPAFRRGECMPLQPAEVRWASGATASIADLKACPAAGRQQQFVFLRPDVDGRDIDANFSAQRLQAAAIERLAAEDDDPPPPAVKMPTNCTSRVVGRQIQTTCY